MNFLHILANIDAYQACLLDTEGESPRAASSVRFAEGQGNPRDREAASKDKQKDLNNGLRPTSVQSVHETSNHVTEFRPKSGKSLTFHLGPDRLTSSLSISNAEFKQRAKRVVKTPLSARRVPSAKHGLASGRDTVLSSIREGARTPTPNAPEDMEHDFLDLQLERCGLTIWRIQGKNLSQIEDPEFGFFHEGNSYLILNINRQAERTLHYWIGSGCCEADATFVEEKAHELDKILSYAHIFSREVQNNESVVFQRLFPDGIIYIEGKHRMSVSCASTYDKKMYLVTGRKYARAECVHPRKDHLRSSSAVILDSFPRIYVWIGQHTGYVLRNKAIRIARKIQQKQRRGKSHIVVIDENDDALSEAFKRKFDDPIFPIGTKEGTNDASSPLIKDEEIQLVLYRVSGDRVLYDMPEAAKRPLHHRYLTKRDSYLLDRGSNNTTYIWVGSDAMEDNISNALSRAKSFSLHNKYDTKQSLCRIQENHEPTEFKQCFCDWTDRLSKDMSLTKRYSAGNVGRALFSRTDRRTIATLKEYWSEDTLGDIRKNTQVWVLNNDKLDQWDHVGLFTNNKCFLVLHTTIEMSHYQHVIYYWMGSRSSPEDQEIIVQLAFDKDDELDNRAILIRVLDFKEPQHFLTSLQNWMIVYDGTENTNSELGTKMFCVRDFGERATRIQQVVPEWKSLNSSSSFMILAESNAYLWYGRHSGSTEREAAKELLGILCSSRMYSYEVVTEGKETSTFSAILGAKTEYADCYKDQRLERRPPVLFHHNMETGTFSDIEDFQQEDLSEEDIYILDSYDQIFVWCGERVGKDKRRKLSELAKEYIRSDPAGRDKCIVSIWVVSQRSEPVAFSKHFSTWNALGYSGRHSYEVMRKRIRQENAKIDVNQNMVDTSFLTQPKYPYKDLLKKELPHDVDDTNKHNHLSEKQFQKHLKISRLEFYRLPMWKQAQILRSAKLLYKPKLTTKPIEQPLSLL